MLKASICSVALSLLLISSVAQGDVVQLQRRLESISTLIERSSGAKQIEASASQPAQRKRDVARALHQQAVQALQAGDEAGATRALDEAAKTMLEAVRLAAPEQINDQKDKRDFETRLASASALLDAQKRIAVEKSDAQSSELVGKIEVLLQRARELAASGNLSQARVSLDQGYLASKAAVANMRAGDTLVRSLKFETREEEYNYEIDRNDTHRMLIEVLLQDKRANNAAIDGMVRKSIDSAQRLRRAAEEQAAAKDHAAAIKTLEDSTKELVKAIRGAGVYIPG